MRIAQVMPYGVHPYSGVRVGVVGLAAALADRGHDVEVWSPSPWPRECEEQRAELDRARVRVLELGGASAWRLGAAASQVRARSVDVIHLHNVFSPLNNRIASVLSAPYVLSPHGGYSPAVLARNRWRKSAFWWAFEWPMLRSASLLTALTDAEVGDLAEAGVGEVPVHVIPYGVHPFADREGGAAVRAELQIPSDARVALYAGRMDLHHKRVDALLRALAEAPEWTLILAGPDWREDRAEIERHIGRLGIAGRVRLLPARRGRALAAVFAAADVFCLPSRWEGLSTALLQALASGLPALVSPEVGRTLDVASLGVGWIVRPEGMGAALRSASTLPLQMLREMGDRGMRLASEYRWSRVATRWEAAVSAEIGPLPPPDSRSL